MVAPESLLYPGDRVMENESASRRAAPTTPFMSPTLLFTADSEPMRRGKGMMRWQMWRGLSTAGLLVCVSAMPVAADCAWWMWRTSYGGTPVPWTRYGEYETRDVCWSAIKRAVAKHRGQFSRGSARGGHFVEVFEDYDDRYFYTCATGDPDKSK